MMVCRYIAALLFAVIVILSVSAQGTGNKGESLKRLMLLPPFERAVLIIKHYETLHSPVHWPYIGYGHRVREGESYKRGIRLDERQADALLRSDLRERCATFRRFGRDSLLLAALAYQVGEARLLGGGKWRKSRLVSRLETGDRNIYREYISFWKWRGKTIPSIGTRRKIEYLLLFEP